MLFAKTLAYLMSPPSPLSHAADYNWHVWHYRQHEQEHTQHTAVSSRVLTTTGVRACPASSSEAHTPAARVHVRTRRQVEADETGCSAGEVHKRAAAALQLTTTQSSPVRGRGPVRGRAGVPAPPGEPGVGERREAAGAGQQLGQGSAAAASEARTTRVRRRARTHGGAARGCPERRLCDGVAHGCGGRSWGRGRLGAPGARVDASTLMSSSGTRSGGAARAAACGVVTEGSE